MLTDFAAIAQNRDPISDLKNFFQVMRDVDNPETAMLNGFNDIEQVIDLYGGK
jgi:hypothetical protein